MEKPSKSCAHKEVKGVVDDDEPGRVVDNRSNQEMKKKEGKNSSEKPKGMPHQQVPQPGDFSAEALDKELPPTDA
ncbi:unnamed protein product [Sphenostylis stenocarpa]|uniref:Uncharacterized protein n=1 Tax=Sphenostylis stenocarpa TaxID=92480 RepID=A0AA86RY42_9FABA|nr:unnamed protein product [Sphenostylis stenocarpa]